MKRTTIYLAPELEMRLKMEGVRRGRPMAELVREAVEVYLADSPASGPPGAGAFASGRAGTADDVDAALTATEFGAAAKSPARPRATPRRPSRQRATRRS
jgi:hypothetical protein